jgi:hypothetical protein
MGEIARERLSVALGVGGKNSGVSEELGIRNFSYKTSTLRRLKNGELNHTQRKTRSLKPMT